MPYLTHHRLNILYALSFFIAAIYLPQHYSGNCLLPSKLNLLIRHRIYCNYLFLSHKNYSHSVPSEMYKFGTQYWACAISGIIVNFTRIKIPSSTHSLIAIHTSFFSFLFSITTGYSSRLLCISTRFS